MISNHIKTAWRNLKRQMFHSIVNICGLAIGLSTAILLLLWVQHERSYDCFHKDYDRIYRFTAHMDASTVWTGVPGPLAVFAQSLPGVEGIVRTNQWDDQVLGTQDRSKILDGFTTTFVDSTFLSLFNFELLEGQKAQLFPNPNSIILTETTAKTFFGNARALGKVLRTQGNDFTVTGVLHDVPDNSSLTFDALLPMSFKAQRFTNNGGNGEWKTIDTDLGGYNFTTFVKLREGATPETVGQKFTQLYKDARNGDSKV